MTKAKDQRSQSMKEQAYNKDKDQEKIQEHNVKAILRNPRPCYDCEHGSLKSIRTQALREIVSLKISSQTRKLVLREIHDLNFRLKVNAARHKLTTVVDVNAIEAKPTESKRFANPIKYALTVNPTIYTSCIEHFWATTMAKNINIEAQIHAKVDGKKVIISEATIRRDLKFEDEGGVDCLSNEVIFEQLPLMRKQKPQKTRRKDTELAQTSVPTKIVTNKAVYDEMYDSVERAATTATGLDVESDRGIIKLSLNKEDASKQERSIANINADDETILVDETIEDQGRYDDQDMFDTSVLDDEEEVLLKEA
nr:hypothetical protein [Tanacetum cinerariifolium]